MALNSKKTARLALDSNKAACLASNSKKLARVVKNGIIIFSVFCYRFARKHPIISSLLFCFGLLYVVHPWLFFFLVSSSPVLISTALLLGTLLSLGQPHIPQIGDIEEEVYVTKLLNRRFQEGIDDFPTRRYIDAENLLYFNFQPLMVPFTLVLLLNKVQVLIFLRSH